MTELFSFASSYDLHHALSLGVFPLGVATIIALCFVSAPYGRHERSGWGPTIPSRLGWTVMEFPAPACFLWWYLQGPNASAPVPLVCLSLWLCHYLHRTFIFPLRARLDGKRMPALVAALAIAFNILNAYINSHWVSHFAEFNNTWFFDPRFIIGLSLFCFGMWLNISSDNRLMALRKPGGTCYRIPRGGGFEHVSAPNYLGEFIEWCGWAMLTWSLAGAAFAFYTAANLFPRAWSNHVWYRKTFPDYPPERRAIIPFVL